MIYLFEEKGLRALQKFVNSRAVFAFDYDGTLCPIVSKHEAAHARRSTNVLMQMLAAKAPTAVISGRALPDLRRHLEFKPRFAIGNHGLEGLRGRGPLSRELRKVCSVWMKEFELPNTPGLELENKRMSLSLHYRDAPNRVRARAALLRATQTLNPPPRIISGKSVLNLVPRQSPHKGTALLEIMTRARASTALFIGDDVTDEDVFELRDKRILTIRVGNGVRSKAKYYIKTQSEIDRVLRTLLSSLS